MHIAATPLASVAVSDSDTAGSRVHLAPALILRVHIGGTASTMSASAAPCPVPPTLVARMLSRRVAPLAAVIPRAAHVKLGMAPLTVAGRHVSPPSIVYSHPVTALSLSLKAALRSKGLVT